jgi:menaquinone-dependent protoporphyrinogen oxidase
MSRILVAHASRFGQARALASELADRLRHGGHEVEIACAADRPIPLPQAYDAVILGSRITRGRHAREILDYVRTHRAVLDEMPTAFFSVSLAAAVPFSGQDPGGHLARTFRELDWRPDHAVAYSRIGAPALGDLPDLVTVDLPRGSRVERECSPIFGPV